MKTLETPNINRIVSSATYNPGRHSVASWFPCQLSLTFTFFQTCYPSCLLLRHGLGQRLSFTKQGAGNLLLPFPPRPISCSAACKRARHSQVGLNLSLRAPWTRVSKCTHPSDTFRSSTPRGRKRSRESRDNMVLSWGNETNIFLCGSFVSTCLSSDAARNELYASTSVSLRGMQSSTCVWKKRFPSPSLWSGNTRPCQVSPHFSSCSWSSRRPCARTFALRAGCLCSAVSAV